MNSRCESNLISNQESKRLYKKEFSFQEEEEEIYAPSRLQEMENELAAKNMVVEELSRELEEIRATFGAEGVQQVLV